MTNKADYIPTRRGISGLAASMNADLMFDKLVAAWGLRNATKIVKALQSRISAEGKRRKGLGEKEDDGCFDGL